MDIRGTCDRHFSQRVTEKRDTAVVLCFSWANNMYKTITMDMLGCLFLPRIKLQSLQKHTYIEIGKHDTNINFPFLNLKTEMSRHISWHVNWSLSTTCFSINEFSSPYWICFMTHQTRTQVNRDALTPLLPPQLLVLIWNMPVTADDRSAMLPN